MASQVALLLREIKDSLQASAELALSTRGSSFSIPQISSLLRQKQAQLMRDYETLQTHMDLQLKIIGKTELVFNILSYKMYEAMHNFRTQTDAFKKKRDEAKKTPVTRSTETDIAFTIVELDKNILESEQIRQKQMEALKEQKIETQTDYESAVAELDKGLDLMKRCYNNLLLLLEAQKANASSSEINIINIKSSPQMESMKREINEYEEMQTKGWRELYAEEKISEVLDRKGLKVTRSGHFLTSSGKRMSFKQAQRYRLLDDLDLPWDEIFDPAKLSEDSPGSSNTSSESNFSNSDSKVSRMSLEDINYLKDKLGKPLTLALAEITAVRPRDPIHYLGHWLYKHRFNSHLMESQEIEFAALAEEREKIAKEKWHQFIEAEARQAVLDMIMNAEKQAALNELKRWQELHESGEEDNEERNEEKDKEPPFNIYDILPF